MDAESAATPDVVMQGVFIEPQTHKQNMKLLSIEARESIPLNKERFYKTEKIISDGVKKGQHVYHILKTHNLPISKSTV